MLGEAPSPMQLTTDAILGAGRLEEKPAYQISRKMNGKSGGC